MKKITLFLSVLLMALVVKAQDAEIETYDFKNWPESSVTLTVGDVIGKVNGADVSQCKVLRMETVTEFGCVLVMVCIAMVQVAQCQY